MLLKHNRFMLTNKLAVLLIAFTGLMAAVYSMAKACAPQPIDWATISLPDPPKPLPDPTMTAAALVPTSDLALAYDSTTKEIQ